MLLIACCSLLSACGFHLRGLGSAELPAELMTLRVTRADTVAVNDPLLVAVRAALVAQAGVQLTDAADAPRLVLFGEHVESRVLTVRTGTGKGAEYLLHYRVSFRVEDASGVVTRPAQSVRLERDYTFDPARVLAKESEERELRNELRRDAAQQIVRRLAKR